jgi:tRNA (adenine57-N1/adenine58-N1)-methyltransferase
LDLHPPYQGSKIQILEAGTGHGALTLYLAQAIQNFNPPTVTESYQSKKLSDWKANRKAIIHTVDISAKHSEHAQKIVQNFRNGIYIGNVDFHVGDLPEFFANYESNCNQFLTHVILDMPSSDEKLGIVAEHLQVDGKLLVFNPSVSQIMDCVERITQERIPLRLERVLELAGSFSGGREWDIRITKIRKSRQSWKASEGSTSEATPKSILSQLWFWVSGLFPGQKSITPILPERQFAIVCRPKAGERIPVGGFVGVWRRLRDDE